MPDVLHVICTRLRKGHLSVRVGEDLRRSDEIVKNLKLRLSMRLSLLLHGTCFKHYHEDLPLTRVLVFY